MEKNELIKLCSTQIFFNEFSGVDNFEKWLVKQRDKYCA